MKRLLAVFVLAIAPVAMLRCSTDSTIAGTKSGSETTNGVTASVRYPGGAPVAHAVVRVRTADYLADTSAAIAKTRFDRGDALTDDSGRFSIDSLDTGNFVIEATDANGNAAAVAHRAAGDSVVDLGVLELAPPATITGSAGGPFVRVFARIRGLDRCGVTGSDGRFTVSVPAGLPYSVNIADGDTSVDLAVSAPVVSSQTVEVTADFGTYRSDSLAVRALLDSMGFGAVSVSTVAPYDSGTGRIRRLDLSNRGLAEVPSAVGNLAFLWSLDVSRNPITDLPATLDRIPLLAALDLDSTRLSALPSVVTRCVHLQWLFLSRTGIRDLPAGMTQLAILHELWMQDDSLEALPAPITTLRSLKLLSLSRNRLTQLPASIGNLDSLEYLHLDENLLDSLPQAIASMPRLKVLYAYRNRISALPDSIGRLTVLNRLEVQENQLAGIPASIGRCAGLRFLHLWGNQLTTLPAEIVGLSLTDGLWLGANRLCNLPASIATWADTYAEPTWLADQTCP